MTSSLPDRDKSVLLENFADFQARETRSLPNGYLDLGYEDLGVHPPGDFRR